MHAPASPAEGGLQISTDYTPLWCILQHFLFPRLQTQTTHFDKPPTMNKTPENSNKGTISKRRQKKKRRYCTQEDPLSLRYPTILLRRTEHPCEIAPNRAPVTPQVCPDQQTTPALASPATTPTKTQSDPLPRSPSPTPPRLQAPRRSLRDLLPTSQSARFHSYAPLPTQISSRERKRTAQRNQAN